jgi:putative FmdB family regulatory protein
MPVYDYQCQACGRVIEVVHSISQCDNPSEQLLEEITCPMFQDCQVAWRDKLGMELPTDTDLIFKRKISEPNIQGSYGGSSLSGKEKLATIQKERKERSHQNFKKEVFPTLPKQEKAFFEKKWNKKSK